MSKITLHGFNNLTKSLSFSLYKLHYLNDGKAHQHYSHYVNQQFCSDNLNTLLVDICHAIGGNVLNIATQDYQPQGASVTLMISEEATPTHENVLVAHLDKSHLCIHTYPEEAPHNNIAIFRADIELSTCGVISPLKVLDYVIETFDADVIDIDFRVRGMTRDEVGNKLFNLDSIEKISDFIKDTTLNNYIIKEYNFSKQNLFHTKLTRKKIELNKHLFNMCESGLPDETQRTISLQLAKEMEQLFNNSL